MSELVPSASSAALRRVFASELTPIDCDLDTGLNVSGTGAATDGTAAINAFLATATAHSPVEIIFDGGVLCSGIIAPYTGYWTISGLGWGTGFFMSAGVQTHAIATYPPNLPNSGFVTTNVGSNIALRNLRINGNRANIVSAGFTGTAPLDSVNGAWCFGLYVSGIDNIVVENVWFYDIANYSVAIGNCNYVNVTGCRMESPGRHINTDAIHVNGSCSVIHISDCRFGVGDDAVALNANEGNGGPISYVTVTNCIYETCVSFMRLYPGTGSNIDEIVMSNCVGSSTYQGFILGSSYTAGGTVGRLSVSNCDFQARQFLSAWPSYSTTRVEMNGVRLTQETTATVNPWGGFDINHPIGTLVLNGFSCSTALSNLFTGGNAIAKLVLALVDSTNIGALFSSGVTKVAGPDVLASGFAVADAAMANGTPYWSSDANVPSIKDGSGTAKRFTLA